jgi:CheY-like chemotaxis protein
MSLRVLLLEDDAQQRRDLEHLLEHEFHAKVESRATESEFRDAFEKIAANPPDLAVLDVMVRWTNPTRESISLPDEAQKPETAGLRCAQMLRESERTKDVKVILYSVLPKEHLGERNIPAGVDAVVKETDFEDLLSKISELDLDKLMV